MKRSIGLAVIAIAIIIAPIIYVVANYEIPKTLNQMSAQRAQQEAQPNIIFASYLLDDPNLTFSFTNNCYELWGVLAQVDVQNIGNANGYCDITYYLSGVAQCVHTVFVEANRMVVYDSAYIHYRNTPIAVTPSEASGEGLNITVSITSQWKA
jgi:hypothetical protein